MDATRTIREWFGNVRWRIGSARDVVIGFVLDSQSRLSAFAGRLAWTIETRLASAHLRRAKSDRQEGVATRVAKMMSKDADSVFVKPRLIAVGICVLLVSGFVVGYALAPRGDFRPSGLDVLPPGTWQNLSSKAHKGPANQQSSRPANPGVSTNRSEAKRPIAGEAEASRMPDMTHCGIESRPR